MSVIMREWFRIVIGGVLIAAILFWLAMNWVLSGDDKEIDSGEDQ